MEVSTKQMSFIVVTLGVLSFIFGIVAENKKPASGTPIEGKGVVICKYSADPTVVLGFFSIVFLIASTIAGFLSLFYPYKGVHMSCSEMFKNCSLRAYFYIAIFTSGLGAVFLIWPTIAEYVYLKHNVHHDLNTDCPTAKTGLIGGGAFLSLNASFFWVLSLMLVSNAREDYSEENSSNELEQS